MSRQTVCDECGKKRIIGTDGLCYECRFKLQDEGAEIFVVLKGSDRLRKVVILDLWLYVEGFEPRYEIKPFETTNQALQRHFPDCKIYLWVPGDSFVFREIFCL
jgi:hypothetical protein